MNPCNPSRRNFLKSSLTLAAAGTAPGLFFSGSALAAGTSKRVLLVIQLDGGCDGLNMVVPYQNPLYYQARPNLALAASTVLPVNGSQALHPAMTALGNLYQSGKVAIVNGVGYNNFNRSHFAAEDIYWTANLSGTGSTGWLGRALDQGDSRNLLAGMYVGSTLPKSMVANTTTVPVIPSVNSYRYQTSGSRNDGELQQKAFQASFMQPYTGQSMFDGLLTATRAAYDSVGQVQQAAAAYQTSITYNSDGLSQNMKLAAQLIHADLGTQVISLAQGGYDTHSNQPGAQERLLGSLSTAIGSFMQDAQAGGFADRVSILVWTEFGRRVAENTSSGTDHGTAAPMLLIGNGVKGGICGAEPNLANLDRGDLKMTTDFRSVYGTALSAWLGVDQGAVLGSSWPILPLFL